MSKFNNYAKQVNDIINEAFEEYYAIENTYKMAETKKREYPQQVQGIVNADHAAKATKVHADFLAAAAARDTFKRDGFNNYRKRIDKVRNDLKQDIDDTFRADPKALDMATLELLKSEMLSADEYSYLIDAAVSANNPTMARLISKYAKDRAEQAEDNKKSDVARAFRAVTYKANQFNGNEYIEAFDLIVSVFDRCSRNPALYKNWDELTGKVIEKF